MGMGMTSSCKALHGNERHQEGPEIKYTKTKRMSGAILQSCLTFTKHLVSWEMLYMHHAYGSENAYNKQLCMHHVHSVCQ